MNFNKEGILNALNDALADGNPNFYDDGTITLEYYPTRKKAEYVRIIEHQKNL